MSESNSDTYVAFVTVPEGDAARDLAHALVQQRLAACVNAVPSVHSTYRWQGKVENERETLLIIKTTMDRKDDLVRAVEELHPHDEPEVVFLRIEGGRPSYLAWIRDSVSRKS